MLDIQSRRRAALRLTAGMAACFAVATAATWARFLLLGTLDLEDHGLAMIHRVWPFVVAGGGMAGAGILYLRALQTASRFAVRHLLGGAVAIHLVAAASLPLTSRDVYSNVAYARLWATGHNPYTSAPADLGAGDPLLDLITPRWRKTPIVYGPLTTILTGLAGGVRAVPQSLALFKLEMLVTSLLCLLAALGICRSLPPHRSREAFFLFSWNPLFVWEVSGQAHNDGFFVLALLFFAWAVSRDGGPPPSPRREWGAALSLAAGIFAKFAAAPAFAALMLLVARRSWKRAAAIALACAALAAVLVAPFWSGAAVIAAPGATLPNHATRTARSLADLARWTVRALGPEAQRCAYWIVAGAGIALCVWYGVRAALRARSLEEVAHDGLLFLLLYELIGAPWFQSWYGTWLLPFALVEDDGRLRSLVALYSVLLLVQYAVPLDPLTYAAIDVFVLYRSLPLLLRPAPADRAEMPPAVDRLAG